MYEYASYFCIKYQPKLPIVYFVVEVTKINKKSFRSTMHVKSNSAQSFCTFCSVFLRSITIEGIYAP